MSISKPFHIISVWIIITIKLFFPEGTQPSWKMGDSRKYPYHTTDGF